MLFQVSAESVKAASAFRLTANTHVYHASVASLSEAQQLAQRLGVDSFDLDGEFYGKQPSGWAHVKE